MCIQAKRETAGPSWRPEPIDPATGYRSLPRYVVQPLLRAVPVSSEVGGKDELVDADLRNGEPSRPGQMLPAEHSSVQRSESPKPNMPSPCIHRDPIPCNAVAATRCPTGACIVHCRLIRAIKEGMDPDTAAHKSARGELEGKGCEAHEAKVAAKKALWQEKRKNRAAAREGNRARRVEAKRKEREGDESGAATKVPKLGRSVFT